MARAICVLMAAFLLNLPGARAEILGLQRRAAWTNPAAALRRPSPNPADSFQPRNELLSSLTQAMRLGGTECGRYLQGAMRFPVTVLAWCSSAGLGPFVP